MDIKILKANCLLFLAAAIWGFAFVAQRIGMEYVGPFTFNGIRFGLGTISLLPLLIMTGRQKKKSGEIKRTSGKILISGGIITGLALFSGASLQQVGLVYTTAGNAGFITGLYIVFVPVLGLFFKQSSDMSTWLGIVLAATGLYFLSITDKFTISFGDLVVLLGTFFWAGHVLIIGWLSPKTDSIKLAVCQFSVCSVLSLIVAFFTEPIAIDAIIKAAVPILYGGLASVGVAYTLQVVAQKDAKADHAAIILSMESPIAAFGGWLILGEVMSQRGFLGCALMLCGMLVSQIKPDFLKSPQKTPEIS